MPKELQKLVVLREEARQRKDFTEADSLRQQLLAADIAVKDTPDGTLWYSARGKEEEEG